MDPYTVPADMLAPSVTRRVVDRHCFLLDIARYVRMGDDDLHRATEACLRNMGLRNMGCLDVDEYGENPDSDLRLVLVPELWERIRPGSRDPLRRIRSSLAEYHEDGPRFLSSMLSTQDLARLRASADDLRRRVFSAASLDAVGLVERVRFAMSGSRAADLWPPEYPVYEPGFTYRLIPVVVWRMLAADHTGRVRGDASDDKLSKP